MRPRPALSRLWLLPILPLLAGACTEIPDFDKDARLSGSRAYPTIEPIAEVVVVGGGEVLDPADAAALQARAEALRRRAASGAPEPVDPRLYEKAAGG